MGQEEEEEGPRRGQQETEGLLPSQWSFRSRKQKEEGRRSRASRGRSTLKFKPLLVGRVVSISTNLANM